MDLNDEQKKGKKGCLLWLLINIILWSIIWILIDNLIVKIILTILSPFLSFVLVMSFGLKYIYKKCPFHNDKKMLKARRLSYDIFYEGKHFCSVSDSIEINYESYNGINRRISSTNIYRECCRNGGNGCPIFEKFKTLNDSELMDYYFDKR